jgi:hypothetical protein
LRPRGSDYLDSKVILSKFPSKLNKEIRLDKFKLIIQMIKSNVIVTLFASSIGVSLIQ